MGREAFQSFLEVVRKASLPGIWSQGVKLAREERVEAGAAAAGNEVCLRVRAAGRAIAPTVTLYPGDGEWSCDCDGKSDPCAHVVAAAIVCAHSDAADSRALAPAETREVRARLVYRLAKKDRLLTLSRWIVRGDGEEERLTAALSQTLSGGKGPANLTPTHEDLRIDRMLGAPARELLPLARIGDLLEALSGSEVTFAGVPVKVSGDRVHPRATVEDAKDGGFAVRIERDPSVTEILAMGVARCSETLRPLADMEMAGDMWERLPMTRTVGRADQAELVTRILPELEKKFPVVVATKKLPKKSKDARPRIAMDLSHQGHTLSVLPTLVYGDPPIARIDGDDVVPIASELPVRRRDEERELLRRLRDELNVVPGRRVDLDGSEAIRFAAKLRDWQQKTGTEAGGAVFDQRPLEARIDMVGDRFDVIFECQTEEGDPSPPRRADASTVLRAWRDGLALVPLDGGGWAPLPAGWLAEHGHRVADLLAARDAEKKLATAALPELGALCEALDCPKPLGLEKLAPLLDGFTRVPSVPLPAGVTATLRSYQQLGVDWLSFLRDAGLGAVLADDMGLGKTLQTLCVLRGRALIVCPKSVVYNWADEIARFRPALKTAIYHGAKRELDETADVTLTTYAILRIDTEHLATEDWDVVVLDEAQAIKNESSQTARAAFQLSGAFRVALSGTPVENRLEELWSIMHFCNPGLLGGRGDFGERYVDPIVRGDPTAAARLRAKIRPFMLRRMKREVLPELPPRTDAVLHVELDEAERSVYDAVRAATRKDIAERFADSRSALAALEALLRLRQAACHSALVPGQTAETSSKIERLLETLEEVASEGHKALVFSQWTSLLDLVEPHLLNANLRFTRLDGSTRDRASVVAEFQDEGGPPVMLVSLKAGGTGLNLTAADHVFLLDPWWNPAVEDQAADRAHRIGQDRPVIVYRMVAKDTVEERIFALQESKRAVANVALGDANQAGGITRAELLALLE